MSAESSWPLEPLSALAEITVGHVGPMVQEYVPTGVPFLRSLNVRPYRIDTSDLVFISEAFHARIAKSALKPGDVVVVRTGTPGVAAVVPESLPQSNCADLVVIHPGPRLDPRFLVYYINGVAQTHIGARVVGAVQQHYNIGSAKQMLIVVPTLSEQRTISSLLGALDDKIEANRRTNKTLEDMAATLFQSWFVDFDPVLAKEAHCAPAGLDSATSALFPASFEASAVGPIPLGWKLVPLDKIATFLNGLALQRYPPNDGPTLPVIKIAQLRSGSTEGADQASADVPSEYTIDDGDLVFSWSGSLLVGLWCGGKGALNQHLFKVTSTQFPKWFCYHWLRQFLPGFQSIAAGKATTMGHIRRHHLGEALIVVPPDDLVRKMDAYIAPLLDLQVLNAIESRTLASVRETLLLRLLSGEIRLSDVQRAVEAVA